MNNEKDKLPIILEYELQVQSPMIHFQYKHLGATLRATEFKPKFDKYLNLTLEKKDKSWYLDDEMKHFKYKVKITNVSSTKIKPHRIYYGKFKEKEEKEEESCVLSDAKLEIICFNSVLREIINKHIADFFLVTNFGTMQRKGFGSFIVKGFEKNFDDDYKKFDDYVTNLLMEKAQSKKCYVCSFNNIDDIFNFIKKFINTMKSRKEIKNNLTHYYSKKFNIRPEKEILRKIAANQNINVSEDIRYIHALLGTTNSFSYPQKKIALKLNSTDIKRSENPIFFKIIKKESTNRYILYFVAEKIDNELYGVDFVVENSNYVFKTPEIQKKLDIHAFLDGFVKEYDKSIQVIEKENK